MTQFLQQLVNGLSLGSIYALIALGYTMVYGIIKLINFAHGDIYMLGAFTAFYATTVFHLNFFLALIVAMVLCGVLGVLIERIAYKPLRHATRITALITAMGVSYILEYTTQYFAGSEVKTFPEDVLNNAIANMEFTGLTGSFGFDDAHTPTKKVLVVQLEDGVQVNPVEVDPNS